MRSSHKPRSRGKTGHRRNNLGNIVNRVFDSSGPEGKVRGTPQQIIDKYQALARDAQLAGDRIGAENHLQHSEHYTRMLGDAQRELAERREAMEAQRQSHAGNSAVAREQQTAPQDDQPDISMVPEDELFPARPGGSTLVATPENETPGQRRPRHQGNRKSAGGQSSGPNSGGARASETPASQPDGSGDAAREASP